MPKSLLDIPSEVRLIIFQHLFRGETFKYSERPPVSSADHQRRPAPPPIAWTCKILHHEVWAPFFRHAILNISLICHPLWRGNLPLQISQHKHILTNLAINYLQLTRNCYHLARLIEQLPSLKTFTIEVIGKVHCFAQPVWEIFKLKHPPGQCHHVMVRFMMELDKDAKQFVSAWSKRDVISGLVARLSLSKTSDGTAMVCASPSKSEGTTY